MCENRHVVRDIDPEYFVPPGFIEDEQDRFISMEFEIEDGLLSISYGFTRRAKRTITVS